MSRQTIIPVDVLHDWEETARPRAVALPVAYGLPWLALRMVLNAVSARFPAALPCL